MHLKFSMHVQKLSWHSYIRRIVWSSLRQHSFLVIVRQMQEKFRAKGKKLCFGFVDLEKAFDSVPREVISWELKNG